MAVGGVRFKLSDSFRKEINFAGVDERGKTENFSFTGIFKRLPLEQAKELYEQSQKPGVTDADLLRQVMTGWTMLDADTKDAVPFTEENIAQFCAIPGAAGITLLEFFKANGVAREKN